MRLTSQSRSGLGMRAASPAVVSIQPRAAAPTASRPVVGFVADQTDSRQQDGSELLDAAGVVTLKERVMQTGAFRAFQGAIENKVRQADRLT